MTKEELEKEAREYSYSKCVVQHINSISPDEHAIQRIHNLVVMTYIHSAEPREKRIAELEKELGKVEGKLADLTAEYYELENLKNNEIAELKKIEEEYYGFTQKKNEEDWKGDNVVGCLKLKIEQLKAQIEKMKCCQNCIFMDFSEPNYCQKGVYRERQYVCDKWTFGN